MGSSSGDRVEVPPIRVLEVELMVVDVLGGLALFLLVLGVVMVMVKIGSDLWLKGAFVTVGCRIVRVNVSHCEKREADRGVQAGREACKAGQAQKQKQKHKRGEAKQPRRGGCW